MEARCIEELCGGSYGVVSGPRSYLLQYCASRLARGIDEPPTVTIRVINDLPPSLGMLWVCTKAFARLYDDVPASVPVEDGLCFDAVEELAEQSEVEQSLTVSLQVLSAVCVTHDPDYVWKLRLLEQTTGRVHQLEYWAALLSGRLCVSKASR